MRMYWLNLKSVALPLPEIEILGGVANPQSWGRGRRRGSKMVYPSKEHWWVHILALGLTGCPYNEFQSFHHPNCFRDAFSLQVGLWACRLERLRCSWTYSTENITVKPHRLRSPWATICLRPNGNGVAHINEVTRRRAGLVPRWVIVCRYAVLVSHHPPRSTQSGHSSADRRSVEWVLEMVIRRHPGGDFCVTAGPTRREFSHSSIVSYVELGDQKAPARCLHHSSLENFFPGVELRGFINFSW